MNAPLSRDCAPLHDGGAVALSHGTICGLLDMLKLNGAAFYRAAMSFQIIESTIGQFAKNNADQLEGMISDESSKRLLETTKQLRK